MKTVWLIILSTLFLTGCVYTRPSPYGYSRYTVVSPRYSGYESPRYYTPAPAPRFRIYEERPHFHSHQRSRRYW